MLNPVSVKTSAPLLVLASARVEPASPVHLTTSRTDGTRDPTVLHGLIETLTRSFLPKRVAPGLPWLRSVRPSVTMWAEAGPWAVHSRDPPLPTQSRIIYLHFLYIKSYCRVCGYVCVCKCTNIKKHKVFRRWFHLEMNYLFKRFEFYIKPSSELLNIWRSSFWNLNALGKV